MPLNFKPQLLPKALDGSKTVTRRQMSDRPRSPWLRDGSRLPKPGQIKKVLPGRGNGPAKGEVRIVWVNWVRLGDITTDEALREGFNSVEEFEAAWMLINGGWDADEIVWRVEFEPVDPDRDTLSIDALKTVQRQLHLENVHLVHLGEAQYTVAHTDAERRLVAREPSVDLTDCDLHCWLAELDGPPADPGVYLVDLPDECEPSDQPYIFAPLPTRALEADRA
ncbi:MAG: hypothetical protein PGN13_16205 [Patulibacter minatonensis]